MLRQLRQIINVLKFACGGIRPLAGPLKVQWDILYRCNSRCITCDRWQALEGNDNMSLEREKKLLDELAALGTFSVAFSGGEPFLRKDIFELFRYARQVGLTTSVNSNGLLITDALADKIVQSGLDMIYLSLDGGTPETNDYIRGVKGSFEKIFTAIERLKRAGKDRPKIFINCTVNNRNVGELVQLVQAARAADVDGVTIQPAHSCDEMEFKLQEDLVLSDASIPQFEEQLAILQRDFPDMFPMMDEYFSHFSTFVKNPAALYRYRCVAAYTTVQVHPNGDVYSCPVAFEKMGNLKKSTFGDIWFSRTADDLRNRIKAGKHPLCWFTCVAPANILLSNIHPLRFHKLFKPDLIRHILYKMGR
ncbi:MAG TPA: radical SAM protein [Desulfuromonadaceae bacterium]|jgi:MoaA/NifB/PqqE/SkfB family radical SAM enzyme